MRNAAVDLLAIALGIVIAAVITGVTLWAHRGHDLRRTWIAAGVVTAVLAAIGMLDLLRAEPRETPLVTAVAGAALPSAGAVVLARLLRRVRPWVRVLSVFVGAFLLLFAGLLLGATLAARLG